VLRPDGEAPSAGYSVFMAVDGNMVFPIAVAVNATFALAGKASLVVGVGYPTNAAMDLMSPRTRDLTPPTPLERLPQRPHLPPPKAEDYGGDEAFFAFLTEELSPLLAREYPINMAELTLYGHSWGRLFTVGALLKHPASFKNFIASSPSIWWNDRYVLKQLREFRAEVPAGKLAPRLLLTVGGAEETAPTPIPQMTLDLVAERAGWTASAARRGGALVRRQDAPQVPDGQRCATAGGQPAAFARPGPIPLLRARRSHHRVARLDREGLRLRASPLGRRVRAVSLPGRWPWSVFRRRERASLRLAKRPAPGRCSGLAAGSARRS